jgi:hypothetical protein
VFGFVYPRHRKQTIWAKILARWHGSIYLWQRLKTLGYQHIKQGTGWQEPLVKLAPKLLNWYKKINHIWLFAQSYDQYDFSIFFQKWRKYTFFLPSASGLLLLITEHVTQSSFLLVMDWFILVISLPRVDIF